MKKETQIKFKKKNGRYCCDVTDCRNYAYAEMYRAGAGAWMYVCLKHMNLKLKPATKKSIAEGTAFIGKCVKEPGLGFYILPKKRKK